jgi:hypothetical protein
MASANPISFFNELSQQSGPSILADSNVDWGQGLPGLQGFMRANGPEVIYLSFFGTDRPEAYGIRFVALPGYGRIGPPGGEAIPHDAKRHVVAISFNNLIGLNLPDPEMYAFLRSRTPIAVVAGSIWIFDLTDDDALQRIRSLSSL